MIEKLINDELRAANKKFPLFSSWHEAYAVILEEVEEAQAEVAGVQEVTVNFLWPVVKNKIPDPCTLSMYTGLLRGYAVKAIEELIQVAAMCDKAVMSLAGEETKE